MCCGRGRAFLSRLYGEPGTRVAALQSVISWLLFLTLSILVPAAASSISDKLRTKSDRV
jgi:hypothetical protein